MYYPFLTQEKFIAGWYKKSARARAYADDGTERASCFDPHTAKTILDNIRLLTVFTLFNLSLWAYFAVSLKTTPLLFFDQLTQSLRGN